jgi:hypothetical protein
MARKILREIYNADQTRRVLIVERENKAFGFEEEYFSDDPLEMSWCDVRQKPFAICDSPETALTEATGRIEWLATYLRFLP